MTADGEETAAPTATELELYKLAVEMADRVSARRGLANSFFLTVNTGLAALLGGQHLRWYAAAAGIVLALTWWWMLQAYRGLNRAKFQVIIELEQRLPLHLYEDEWARLQAAKQRFSLRPAGFRIWLNGYRELGVVERIVPLVFAAIYVAYLVERALS